MNLDYTRADGISATESRNLTGNSRDENELHVECSGQLGEPLRLLQAGIGLRSTPLVHLSVADLEDAVSQPGKQMGHGRNRHGSAEGERSRRNFGPLWLPGKAHAAYRKPSRRDLPRAVSRA